MENKHLYIYLDRYIILIQLYERDESVHSFWTSVNIDIMLTLQSFHRQWLFIVRSDTNSISWNIAFWFPIPKSRSDIAHGTTISSDTIYHDTQRLTLQGKKWIKLQNHQPLFFLHC